MKFTNILVFVLIIGVIPIINAQIVNIPDPNFKNALVNTLCVPMEENSCEGFFPVDINGNGEIEVAEAEIVEDLCIQIQDIASLEGIQAFINLETLHVENNELTTIDLTQNFLLKELYVQGNMISSIDVSNLIQLEILNVFDNNLTSLDVTNNANLIRLRCSFNNLVSLDLTQNPQLDVLSANNNVLSAINVTQNTSMRNLDVGTNQLTSIDLSQNPDLIDISVFRNQITLFDASNKPDLLQLSVGENPIEGSINVTQSPLLFSLLVEDTQISGLNIQNGNNENLTTFRAFNTPNLYCIQVDNPLLVTAGGSPYDDWEVDTQAFYSEDCSLGVNDLDSDKIQVYPNPAGDTLFISSKNYDLKKVVIYNVEGKQLLELKQVPSQISLAHIPSGILFVKVTTDHGMVTKKVVKM